MVLEMEDYGGSEDDYFYSYSDQDESIEEFENDDSDVLGAPCDKRSTIKVITRESLFAAQREDLRKVMELLSLREHHARTLLIYYRWDVEKILTVLVDRGKECLYLAAGVMVDDHHSNKSIRPCSVITCKICMEESPASNCTRMDCSHCFCNDCWTEHFAVKINERQSKQIRCMAHKCNAICDEAVVRNLVSKRHPDLAEKYERFLIESYVEDNKMVKWCPSVPHCGNAIRIEDDEVCEVECSCGMQFCFSCLSEAHSPCSCRMWKLWKLWTKKCQDKSETDNWMTTNTKPCPDCQTPVVRNGGCSLMTCVCGRTFCWKCGGATGRVQKGLTIVGHSCTRYKEEAKKKKPSRAKRELNRYMHYHDRYKAHMDSFELEKKLEVTIKGRVLSISESPLRDFNWVTSSLDVLLNSRRVLAYSYPFAYYMFGEELFKEGKMTAKKREIRKNLFEDQQQQLELNVEKLSKFLEEQPVDLYDQDDDKIMETRMQLTNLAAMTETLCKGMYDCIENDLLGSLQSRVHRIAPYKSKGIEKASQLST